MNDVEPQDKTYTQPRKRYFRPQDAVRAAYKITGSWRKVGKLFGFGEPNMWRLVATTGKMRREYENELRFVIGVFPRRKRRIDQLSDEEIRRYMGARFSMEVHEIAGPPWCMCESCQTCQQASFDLNAGLTCKRDGQAHEYESSCDVWEPYEQGTEDCEGAPCETCVVGKEGRVVGREVGTMSKLNEAKWRKFCYDNVDGVAHMLLTAIELHFDGLYDRERADLDVIAHTAYFFNRTYADRIWAMGCELDRMRWQATYNRRYER